MFIVELPVKLWGTFHGWVAGVTLSLWSHISHPEKESRSRGAGPGRIRAAERREREHRGESLVTATGSSYYRGAQGFTATAVTGKYCSLPF